MKIIEPSAVIMKHDATPYEFIEKVGRTCYKSEDKIKEGSAEKFVANLVSREHWAMLEHETIYLILSDAFMKEFLHEMENERERADMYVEPLSFFKVSVERGANILSGSFRSFHDLFMNCKGFTVESIHQKLHNYFPEVFSEGRVPENDLLDCEVVSRELFKKLYSDKPHILYKHLTHTVKFTCDRGVSHELVRHRPCSFAQESTRYCNYSLGKFGKEITVIKPFFWCEDSAKYAIWKSQMRMAEGSYFSLIDTGSTPQEARAILPNSLKTEIIMTATEGEWQHIINLRYLGTTGAPHPQMKEVMSIAVAPLVVESDGRIKI